jgi:small subunit ribosomal protein S15
MARKTKEEKLKENYQQSKKDTGSTSVQIIDLSAQINELADHLKNHKKDFSSRVGFLKMISKRRKLLLYLKKEDENKYNKLIKDLDL